MARCKYDTGSMYGCEPACSREATQVFTYSTGQGAFTVPLCRGHVSPMAGRVWPYSYTVQGV